MRRGHAHYHPAQTIIETHGEGVVESLVPIFVWVLEGLASCKAQLREREEEAERERAEREELLERYQAERTLRKESQEVGVDFFFFFVQRPWFWLYILNAVKVGGSSVSVVGDRFGFFNGRCQIYNADITLLLLWLWLLCFAYDWIQECINNNKWET